MKISGKFDVKIKSLDCSIQGLAGVHLGRMSIDKTFYGDLEGASQGEMLSTVTATEGSAGYVAIEQVQGSLLGKKGSFILQHFGIMDKNADRLILDVIPDSAAGELVGLSGSMKISIENNQHFYEFEYTLPE